MSFVPFLQAATGASSTSSMVASFLPFILIIAIFYFFIIRPQNKKQKETQKMLDALKKGDKVVTIGGIHGVISSVKENTVVVKVDDNSKIEFNRTAISTVVVDKPAKTETKNAKAESKVEENAAETTESSSSTEKQ